jgi:hypothetical protein
MDAPQTQRGDVARGRGQHHSDSTRESDGELHGADNEATPLLDNGHDSPGENPAENGALPWEGADDFRGLKWWRTPSVRCGRCSPVLLLFLTRCMC